MLVRIATALVGIPIIFAVMYYGKIALLTFVLLIVMLGMHEYLAMAANMNIKAIKWICYVLALSFPLITYFTNVPIDFIFVTVFLLSAIVSLVFGLRSFKDTAFQLFGIIYLGGTLSYLLKIRALPDGFRYLLLTMLFIWMSDSAAYFTGMLFGKHKLAPALSPKKSIEGSIGGLFFTILLAILLAYIWHLSLLKLVGMAILVNIFSQLGDLVESAIKRQADIKDSGKLLPGHGGVLDRFDSTFFAMPIVYQYLFFFLGR